MVLHNMLRTCQGRADRAPTQENDVVDQQNQQMVYVTDDKYTNPAREAQHQ